jgi:hypothetical protein
MAFLAVAAMALGMACLQGTRAPQVAPRGTLAPGGEAATVDVQGPFGVVFGAPRGEMVDPPEVSLVFNRAMRPLELAGDESTLPAKIQPAVPGRWHWVGTTALTFVPEGGRLPRATSFVVEVPAGTRALDGSTLGKAYELRFSTVRPSVISIQPNGEDMRPDQKFEVRFNQPVTAREVEQALAFEVGEEDKLRRVAAVVRQPDPQNEQLYEISTRVPLPLDTPFRLVVGENLKGKEGPLTVGAENSFSFRTYGRLRVREVRCDRETPHGRCSPENGIGIELTNRVKVADLKRAVRIEPKVAVNWPSWMSDEDEVSSVQLYGRYPAGHKVSLTIAAGLKDKYGQTLAGDYREDVAFDDLWPKAEIGLRGSVFEPVGRRDIPIEAINAADLEVVVAKLSPAEALRLQDGEYDPGKSPTYEQIAALPGARRAKVPMTAAINKPTQHLVRTADALGGKDARGALAIGLTFTGWPGSTQERRMTSTAIAKVSDLAVSAKISARGSLLWVSRLSTAAPVKGAEVTLERPGEAPIGPFQTDDSGFVSVPENVWKPRTGGADHTVLVVREGQDWTYKHVEEVLSTYRYGASVNTSAERPFGLVFTDRGIYRPGDTVHVKGIFRKERHPGTVTPAGVPVELRVEGPDGDAIATRTEPLSPFGTASIDVVVPKTGRLGTYAIRANVGEGGEQWADVSGDFEVAEYRPAEFKVSVESDRPSYVRGDKAKWIARGDYLYGAPMGNAEARLSVTRGYISFEPPNTEGFTTSDAAFHADLTDTTPRESEIQSSMTKLDGKGTAAIDAVLALPGQRGPEGVTAEAEVTDVSRQSIAGSTTAIVHPAEFYVALKSGADLFVDAGKPLSPEVFAVDPAGKKLGGIAVKVDLVQRTWTVARQATSGGATHTEATPVDKVAASCNVTTAADKPASCKIEPTAAGYYLIHATATDKRKNPVGASEPVYVFGAGGGGWGDSDSLAIELVPDRDSYEVGQTAKILVKSPFASADALVTVERAGVLEKRRVKLSGPMSTVEVPITDALRPNAFVSVLIVRGRSKAPPASTKDPDVGAPAFRMGYTSLAVNPEKRRLSIALAPSKPEARPGDNVDVDLTVRDHAGKPARAEVTFYAVDEGVLSLVDYETPDPIEVFGAERPLRVQTIEVRAALARVFRPFADLGVDKGLDGGDGGGGRSVRRDFRASATFIPSVITDDKGRARVSFRLPDTLTTYRLMAVTAAEDDRFGFAEGRVVASRPIMARPALPRFLRAGDTFEAGVVLSTKGIAKTSATVEMTAEGVALSGEARKTVDLLPGQPVEVRFPVTASKVGKAKIAFRVRAAGDGKASLEDAVEVERDVRVPMAPEAVALYGDTTSESAEKLGDLGALRDDVGGLEVSLASTALVGLGGGVEQLVEYPYGCTEQLVSKLVPLLPLRELAKDFKLNLPPNTGAIVDATAAEILKHQRSDGGFGMWTESPRANLWATTYALWGLGEAKRRGVAVPGSALESATSFVRAAIEGHIEADVDEELVRVTEPFFLDVLAENGSPDPGRAARLFEQRKTLPLFSQALLAHALVLGKGDRAAVDQLVNEMEGALRIDGPNARAVTNHGDRYAVLMDSDTRTTALVLRAMLAARPSHPMAARLAKGLLADRRGGTWRNTQETAWSLLALDLYRRAQEKAAPDFTARVFLGQGEVGSQAFRGRDVTQGRVSLPAARLVSAGGSALAFDVDGSGRLFYEARLRYARKTLPKTPLERGFFVHKTIRPVTPETLETALGTPARASAMSFPGGGLVLAELVVVTPSPREYVVVDDPLPAGFEPVDVRLATTSRGLDVDREGDQGNPEDALDEEGGADDVATGRAYLPSSYLREMRDDRVVFFIDRMAAGMYRYRYLARATTIGTFVLPPTRAEEMYTPEVFGRTGASSVQITPK